MAEKKGGLKKDLALIAPRKEHYKDTPIRRRYEGAGKKKAQCVYDRLFAMDGTADAAIGRTYDIVKSVILRTYGKFLHKRELGYLDLVTKQGNGLAKLMFILGAITHDTALRMQFEALSKDQKDKMDAFFLLLSVMFRSMYESNIREDTGQRILNSVLEVLHRNWVCCDTEGILHFCYWFSSPVKENDYDINDIRESAEDIAKDAIAREVFKTTGGGKK